jgi:hypothetical protein
MIEGESIVRVALVFCVLGVISGVGLTLVALGLVR